MDKIEIIRTVVHARPGVPINVAIKESIKLAISEWRTVELIFNEQEYIIDPNKIMDSIYKDD